MTPADRKRLEAVLPFYVNGRAHEQDRAFVDAMLAHSDEVKAMLLWHEALAEKVCAAVDAVPDDIGLAALRAKVRSQPTAAVVQPSGWRDWLSPGRWSVRALQMPAIAVLSLVVVVQAVLLSRDGGRFQSDAETFGTIRGAEMPSGESSAVGVALKVNFKDETSEHDLRMLLISLGANIVQGPGQLGDYVLMVPSGRSEAVEQALKESKWVNSVRRIKPSTVTP